MIEKKMKVKLSEGLEFGPATMFVQVASKYKSRIYVLMDNKRVNAKSIMGMMTLGMVEGEEVTITPGSQITEALKQGGAVVLRLYLEVPHYVLLTGINEESVLMFDPFYEEEDDPELDQEYFEEGIAFISDSPKKANRAVSLSRINGIGKEYYEMGELSERKALIMFNTSL